MAVFDIPFSHFDLDHRDIFDYVEPLDIFTEIGLANSASPIFYSDIIKEEDGDDGGSQVGYFHGESDAQVVGGTVTARTVDQ